jgi:hypothetical protein
MRKFTLIALVAIFAAALAASPAHATLLGPGAATTIADPLFGPFAYAGGTVEASHVNEAATFSSGISGTLTTEAIKEAGGTYDFLYQITAASSNTTAIHRVTVTDFTSYATNVQYGTAGPPFSAVTAPVMFSADRSADGSTVGWSFTSASSGGVGAGLESYVLIIKTNATNYTTGSTFAIDGGIMTFPSFAPSGSMFSVPEPSSLVLGGIGALGMIGFGLRRRKALGA